MNCYIAAGRDKQWLLARLNLAIDQRDRGNQTGAGVRPGVRHEFSEKSDGELRAIIREIIEALNVINPTAYPLEMRPGRTLPEFY